MSRVQPDNTKAVPCTVV